MHVSPADCRNCRAPLTGPYCAQCGQHAHHSARSLHTLLHEAWHIFTHVDGSFWLTLRRLLTRPGFLTQEYFAERRARYAPPFRLYFVVSLVFFGLNSVASGIMPQDVQTSDHDRIRVVTASELAKEDIGDTAALQGLCDRIHTGWQGLDARARANCHRHAADGGQALLHEFNKLLPKMMFVFLPLMAAVMLPLYRRQHRYYVEHLVFLLHTQSAVFLALLLEVLVSVLLLRLAAVLPEVLTQSALALAGMAMPLYCVWYVYAGLRRYYGQDRGTTLVKYFTMGTTYLVLVGVAAAATLLLSAAVS